MINKTLIRVMNNLEAPSTLSPNPQRNTNLIMGNPSEM